MVNRSEVFVEMGQKDRSTSKINALNCQCTSSIVKPSNAAFMINTAGTGGTRACITKTCPCNKRIVF